MNREEKRATVRRARACPSPRSVYALGLIRMNRMNKEGKRVKVRRARACPSPRFVYALGLIRILGPLGP